MEADETAYRSHARGWFLTLYQEELESQGPKTEAQEEALSGKGESDAPRGGCAPSLPRERFSYLQEGSNDVRAVSDWWSQDRRISNEIASAVFYVLERVRLVADGCGGQNKNSTMVGMVQYWLQYSPSHIKYLQLAYPVVGHHSTALKMAKDYTAFDWNSEVQKLLKFPGCWPLASSQLGGRYFRKTKIDLLLLKVKQSNVSVGRYLKPDKIKSISSVLA
nr:unnamed protein product [Callosobruchus analis]